MIRAQPVAGDGWVLRTILDANQKLTGIITLEDGLQQFNLHMPVKQCFKKLLIPTARAMAIGVRESLLGFAHRSAVTPLVSGMNGLAAAPQMTTADVSLVQPFQQIVQIPGICLQPSRLFDDAAANTAATARPHDSLTGVHIDLSIQQFHQSMNGTRLFLSAGQRGVVGTGLENLAFDRMVKPECDVVLKRIDLEGHIFLPPISWVTGFERAGFASQQSKTNQQISLRKR